MNGDDPKDAVERAATDAAFDALKSRVVPAVSQKDTSVELPGDGEEGDPGEVAELLTDETSTIIRLHYDDPDYLAMMESELRRLENHNLLEGITVITDDPTRFESDLKGRASGLYHTGTGEMYVAPEEIIGEEPRERKAEPGYFSTDKNFGSLWHELGHHRVRQENPDMDFEAMDGEDYWGQEVIEEFAAERFADGNKTAEEMSETELQRAKNKLADHIEAEVGEYANFGGMEFIAEVHAGLMAGNEYDDDIMDLHDRLGGPVPPKSARDPSTAYEPQVAPGASTTPDVGAAIDDAINARVRAAASDENRHIRRLRRFVDVDGVTEIGDEKMVNFHLPDAHPDSMASAIHFKNGGIPEATFRFPSLQEASQASRGVVNRFPEMVQGLELPRHDRFVSEGFDGHMDDLDRGERRIKTRIADRYGNNRLTPHVHLDSGVMAVNFDAAEVLDFLSALIDAYEEEFAPYAPRDDIEFQSTEAAFDSPEDADRIAEAITMRTPAIIDEVNYNGYFDEPNIYVGFTLPSMHPQTGSRTHINSGVAADAHDGKITSLSIRFPGVPISVTEREELEGLLDELNPDGFLRARLRVEAAPGGDPSNEDEYHPHLHFESKRRGERGPDIREYANVINSLIRKWYNEIDDRFDNINPLSAEIHGAIAKTLPQSNDISIYAPKGDEPADALLEAARDGTFDGGAVTVETAPAADLGPWSEPGVPIADNPAAYGNQYATVLMPVEDFRELQTYIGTNEGIAQPTFGNDPPDPYDFWNTHAEDHRVESIEPVLRGEEEPEEIYGGVPMPYIKIGNDGTLDYTQEGRHRTIAAENAGLDTIPVRIIYDTSNPGEGGVENAMVAPQLPPNVEATGEEPSPAVEDFIATLSEWGATRIYAFTKADEAAIDFETPLPGDAPQRASVTVEDGQVTEATLRLGVLQGDYDQHPSRSQEMTDRLQGAIERADPVGGSVLVNFGDFRYPPRPHVLVNWRPFSESEIVDGVIRDGDAEPVPLGEFADFIERAAAEVRDEFFENSDALAKVADNTLEGIRDAPTEVRRFVMRAEQWSDNGEVKVTDTEYGGGYRVWTVDFDTSGGGGMSSSVVIDDNGQVTQMLLRTYPIPADWWNGGKLESADAGEKMSEMGDEIEEYVFSNDPPGHPDAWDAEPRGHHEDGPVPHIWYDPHPNERLDVDDLSAFIQRFLGGYFERWPNAIEHTMDRGKTSIFQLPPGPTKAAADIVREHARGWGDQLTTEDVVGRAIIEFYPRGFPRPEKDFHDNPTTIVINEDATLADAMFRYGYLPDVEWKEDGGKGADILEEMDVPDGVQAEYDLGDFGDIARPHLHLAGTEYGSTGDVDYEELMDFGQRFGERIKEAYDIGDVRAQTADRNWQEMDTDVLDAPPGWGWDISPKVAHHVWTLTEESPDVGWGPEPPLLLESLMGFFDGRSMADNLNSWYHTRPPGHDTDDLNEWWQVGAKFKSPSGDPKHTSILYDEGQTPHPLRSKLHGQQYTVTGAMFTYDFTQWQGEDFSGFMRIPVPSESGLLEELRDRVAELPFEEMQYQSRTYRDQFADIGPPTGTFAHPHFSPVDGEDVAEEDLMELFDVAFEFMERSVEHERESLSGSDPRPMSNARDEVAAVLAAIAEDDAEDLPPVPEQDFSESIEFTEVSPEQFSEKIEDMIEADPEMGAFLSYHPPNELTEHTLLQTEDGGAGVAISPEGDIQNLYNLDGPQGAGTEALKVAIREGGCMLDCYDGYLRDLYALYGFRETGRMEFNPDYAPEGWNEDKFGYPDVVFMAYQPEMLIDPETDDYYTADEWATAKGDSKESADCDREQ